VTVRKTVFSPAVSAEKWIGAYASSSVDVTR
jgi:hypothetical protein